MFPRTPLRTIRLEARLLAQSPGIPTFTRLYTRSAKHTYQYNTSQRIPSVRSASSSSSLFVTVSAIIVGGALIAHQRYFSVVPIEATAATDQSQLAGEPALMAGAQLPGRPGNLTPEQEEKLKEFWVALLHTFGVPDLANGHAATERRPGSQKTDAQADEKRGKKKSLFGKKHDSKAADSMTDGEDKFGQKREFQMIIETQPPEELRQAFWSMIKLDNPDALLLLFLRARKWNVRNALVMLVATMKWRMDEVKVDSDIVRRGEAGALEDSQTGTGSVKKEGHDFLEQMRLAKSFIHGTDKDGRPITYVRVKLHRAGEQTNASLERYTVYYIETARLLLKDNVDTATLIFDMDGFSMANMDYAPVKFMIKCFEANYPESLGVILVHKSPWIFQSIWKIIRGWLDPVVAAKVHFTRNIEELSQFIPTDHILHDMGGDDPWTYSYVPPVKGENAPMKDSAKRDALVERRRKLVRDYELVTQRWLNGETGDVQARRKEMTEQLRVGYWELDPYVRARTYYDRTGVIQPGGNIDFYPSATETKPIANGVPTSAGHVDDDVD